MTQSDKLQDELPESSQDAESTSNGSSETPPHTSICRTHLEKLMTQLQTQSRGYIPVGPTQMYNLKYISAPKYEPWTEWGQALVDSLRTPSIRGAVVYIPAGTALSTIPPHANVMAYNFVEPEHPRWYQDSFVHTAFGWQRNLQNGVVTTRPTWIIVRADSLPPPSNDYGEVAP
jgi:hypothetical protein